jgi:hypothetical protein
MQALKFDAELDADDPALVLGAVLEAPVPGA